MPRVPRAGMECRSGLVEEREESARCVGVWILMCAPMFQEPFKKGGMWRGWSGPLSTPTPPLSPSFLAEGLIYWGFPAIRQSQQRWLH